MFFLVKRRAAVDDMLIVLVTRRSLVENIVLSFREIWLYQKTTHFESCDKILARNIEYIHVKLLTPKTLTNYPKATTETSTARIRVACFPRYIFPPPPSPPPPPPNEPARRLASEIKIVPLATQNAMCGVSTWKRGCGTDRLHPFSIKLRNPEVLAAVQHLFRRQSTGTYKPRFTFL